MKVTVKKLGRDLHKEEIFYDHKGQHIEGDVWYNYTAHNGNVTIEPVKDEVKKTKHATAKDRIS